MNVIRIDSSRAPNPICDTFGALLTCGPFPYELWHLILKYLGNSVHWFSAAQLTVGNRQSVIGIQQSACRRSFRQRNSALGFGLFASIAAHLPTLHKLGAQFGQLCGTRILVKHSNDSYDKVLPCHVSRSLANICSSSSSAQQYYKRRAPIGRAVGWQLGPCRSELRADHS